MKDNEPGVEPEETPDEETSENRQEESEEKPAVEELSVRVGDKLGTWKDKVN